MTRTKLPVELFLREAQIRSQHTVLIRCAKQVICGRVNNVTTKVILTLYSRNAKTWICGENVLTPLTGLSRFCKTWFIPNQCHDFYVILTWFSHSDVYWDQEKMPDFNLEWGLSSLEEDSGEGDYLSLGCNLVCWGVSVGNSSADREGSAGFARSGVSLM